MKRPIERYVDSLIRRRRPKPFTPTEDDVALARTAIELAAAAPDAHQPRDTFIDELRRRLAAQQTQPDPEPSRPAARWAPGRRSVLAGLAVAAAGAAGAVADHTLTSPATEPPSAADSELRPVSGTWQTVATETDLPEGAVLPFDLGAVTGFLRRESGQLHAVSGTCTHQGCRLDLHAARRELTCPCHGATFTVAGRPLSYPHNTLRLAPLARLLVRVEQGHVQILAPPRPSAATPTPTH